MSVAFGHARPYGRRERELLSARRRTAEGRAARERARNSRVALAGFIVLAVAITFGVHTAWAPPPLRLSMKVPTDPDSRSFAHGHIGRLFFNSLDDAVCREMYFNNDTGQFSNEKTIRCDEPEVREDSADARLTDARARAFSIRGGFTSR
jgi:hypothetical protein